MRIAVDISPIDSSSKSAHKVRGVGRYISLLKNNLEKYENKNDYIFTNNPQGLSNVDLIHYPYFDPFFPTLPLFKKYKTIVTIHDLIPITHGKNFPKGIKGNLKWQFNKFLLKRVDGIITDSFASKKAVIDQTGFLETKIFPVFLCIGEEYKKVEISNNDKKRLTEKYSLPENFFLYVGDVTWNKNLPRLVEAIKKINIPLVMIGKALVENFHSNPWNGDRILVEKETDSNLFIKTGYVNDEDLVKIYNLALALLMPSLDEGFGLPVLEAMSCGCPVLTSRDGSLPEVGGDAVCYAESTNIDNIVEKLNDFGSTEFRKTLASKGLEQAKKFSAKKFIEDTVSVYKSING